jgi:hypothetical protein
MSNVKYTEPSCLPAQPTGSDEPLVLEQAISRKWKAIGMTIFALLWNGITWSIGYLVIRDKVIVAMIFLALFALIGLLILFGAIYSILQLFNPTTVVVCSQSQVHPGSEFEISWLQKGNASRIKRLMIAIEAYEEASYRQGTTTRTEKSIFYSHLLVSTDVPDEIQSGFRIFELPLDTMHTFRGSKNKIEWTIRVHGDVPFWPDISDDFSIVILPPQVEKEAA